MALQSNSVLAEAAARQLLRHCNITGLPVNPWNIATILGIAVGD